jgi:hypothetical protein
MQYGWQYKIFKTQKAMDKWLQKNEPKIEWVEIYVNNAFAIEYRKLKVININ